MLTTVEVMRIEGEYVERLRDVKTEAALDTLWNDLIAEPSEHMTDEAYQRFVALDDGVRADLEG